jgi:hypothetical protein
MKTVLLVIIATLTHAISVTAFAVLPTPVVPPPVVTMESPLTQVSNVPALAQQSQNPVSFNSYISNDSLMNYGTSNVVALQERKIPTPEEIAAKKRNFNLWFWGGGFVAPFLATFYYFGLKFWEK